MEVQDKFVQQSSEEEIKLRDIVRGVNRIFKFIFSHWITLVIAGALGAAAGYGISKLIKPKYTADLTFVLSSDSKGGNLSSLASDLGFDMGGFTGNDAFAGENILTLFRSRKMLQPVLFQNPPQSNESLINILIKNLELDKAWATKQRTKGLFPFPKDQSQLTSIQDSLVREVYNYITEKLLTVSRTDKKQSVYQVSTTSTDPVFACYLSRYLMNETANFYIETKTSLAKNNLLMIQREADSLRNLLGGAISSTAYESERTFNLNPALAAQHAPAQKSQVKATILATAYGEVVKNLELAKIALQKDKPLYQILDVPELPLKGKRPSGLLCVLIGSFLFTFLSITIIVFKNVQKKSKLKQLV